MDHVQPCNLFTEDKRAEFGLTGEQTSKFSSTWENDTCKTWDADKVLSASVTAVSNQGIEAFYLGRFTNMQYKATDVRGFPALFYRFDNAEHACYLAVGVADDQLCTQRQPLCGHGQGQTRACQTMLCAWTTRHKESS